jgi:hypothetical protein
MKGIEKLVNRILKGRSYGFVSGFTMPGPPVM